jgi:hypothetical protein
VAHCCENSNKASVSRKFGDCYFCLRNHYFLTNYSKLHSFTFDVRFCFSPWTAKQIPMLRSSQCVLSPDHHKLFLIALHMLHYIQSFSRNCHWNLPVIRSVHSIYHTHLLKNYSNDNPISSFHLYVSLNYPLPFSFTDQKFMSIYNILKHSKNLIHLTSKYVITIPRDGYNV